MDPNDSNFSPPPIPPAPVMAIPYSSLGPSRPGIMTAVAIIGIVLASLGLLTALFGALGSVMTATMSSMPGMKWKSTGMVEAAIAEAVAGLALAAVLMSGSIGLLRSRDWSRTVLLWWAWIYIVSVGVFLALQIVVVVPGQVAMMNGFMSAMPPPATMPAGTVGTTTVSSSNGTTTYTNSSSTATSTATVPFGAIMNTTYIAMAIGKAVICLIFPIAVLIILRLKSVRTALMQ
jgi:hypothetical protein